MHYPSWMTSDEDVELDFLHYFHNDFPMDEKLSGFDPFLQRAYILKDSLRWYRVDVVFSAIHVFNQQFLYPNHDKLFLLKHRMVSQRCEHVIIVVREQHLDIIKEMKALLHKHQPKKFRCISLFTRFTQLINNIVIMESLDRSAVILAMLYIPNGVAIYEEETGKKVPKTILFPTRENFDIELVGNLRPLDNFLHVGNRIYTAKVNNIRLPPIEWTKHQIKNQRIILT